MRSAVAEGQRFNPRIDDRERSDPSALNFHSIDLRASYEQHRKGRVDEGQKRGRLPTQNYAIAEDAIDEGDTAQITVPEDYVVERAILNGRSAEPAGLNQTVGPVEAEELGPSQFGSGDRGASDIFQLRQIFAVDRAGQWRNLGEDLLDVFLGAGQVLPFDSAVSVKSTYPQPVGAASAENNQELAPGRSIRLSDRTACAVVIGMSMEGSSKPFSLPEEMWSYLNDRNSPPTDAQVALRTETDKLSNRGMRFNHESALLLQTIVRAQRPMFCVEVGTFTGYSSLTVASALPVGGRLLCCDVSEEFTSVARRHWAAAGVDDRIELKIGPALETLRALPADPVIEFAVIDADKSNYTNYYTEIVKRLAPHGVIAVDNTMWGGSVLESDQHGDTAALQAFNDRVGADPSTSNVTIPIGDGVTLITHA